MKKLWDKKRVMRLTMGIVGLSLCVGWILHVTKSEVSYASGKVEGDMKTMITMDEEGNIQGIPSEEVQLPDFALLHTIDAGEALEETTELEQRDATMLNRAVKSGVVVFKNKNPMVNTNYINARTKATGYLNATYAPDAAYLGTVKVNGVNKVLFKQSGVIGMVNASEVHIIEYDQFVKSKMLTSYYQVKNGKLYHNITTNLKTIVSTQLFGYKQDYMKEGKKYYSYDGHYFYESYRDMTRDYCTGTFTQGVYKEGSYKNAINPSKPYYNYFLYLSQRTKTKITGNQLDTYLKNHPAYKSTSKMANTGKYFIENQNKYGVNALIMFASAINESAYGNSGIAQRKNNLFGHGASDAYPSYGAVGYRTPQESIQDHARIYISKGYTDPKDSRYYGAHLGNKESGANVCYASDSYWGEKAAAQCFYIVDSLKNNVKEYQAYNLGISTGKVAAYNKKGQELYNSIGGRGGVVQAYPVVILGEENGMYKIQADAPLDASQLKLQQTISGGDTGIYEFANDIVYVKKSMIRNLNTNPSVNGGNKPNIDWIPGDVSGDKQITSLDYVQIKNHIMGIKLIVTERLKAADVSKDGKVTSLDYIKVKNHIMNEKPLQ